MSIKITRKVDIAQHFQVPKGLAEAFDMKNSFRHSVVGHHVFFLEQDFRYSFRVLHSK